MNPEGPKVLFPLLGDLCDIAKDGRFLIAAPVEQSSVPITVVLNWTAGLKT